jgi:hypothetical protein
LTGWAQVNGGRNLSVNDKAALDVWYVNNASLRLDVKILAQTALFLLRGERVTAAASGHFWDDAKKAGTKRPPYRGRGATVVGTAISGLRKYHSHDCSRR